MRRFGIFCVMRTSLKEILEVGWGQRFHLLLFQKVFFNVTFFLHWIPPVTSWVKKEQELCFFRVSLWFCFFSRERKFLFFSLSHPSVPFCFSGFSEDLLCDHPSLLCVSWDSPEHNFLDCRYFLLFFLPSFSQSCLRTGFLSHFFGSLELFFSQFSNMLLSRFSKNNAFFCYFEGSCKTRFVSLSHSKRFRSRHFLQT